MKPFLCKEKPSGKLFFRKENLQEKKLRVGKKPSGKETKSGKETFGKEKLRVESLQGKKN